MGYFTGEEITASGLPEDVEHLLGPIAVSGLSVFVVVLGLAGLYLTNREFWHSLFTNQSLI